MSDLSTITLPSGDQYNFKDSTARNGLSEKANSSHTHDASDIVSGYLPLTRGGTGAVSAAGARDNLGLGNIATISTNANTNMFLRGDGTWAVPASISDSGLRIYYNESNGHIEANYLSTDDMVKMNSITYSVNSDGKHINASF